MRIPFLASLFAFIGVLVAAPVHAALVPATPVWGFEFGGGWSRYAMESFNDSLRAFNRTAGTQLDGIRDGMALGVGLRLWLNERVLLRLGLEKLDAKSVDGELQFDVGCRVVTLGATRYLATTNPVRFGWGGGLGWYHLAGDLGLRNANTSGDGYGAHAGVEAIYSINRRWSFCGALGYRFARVNHIAYNGTEQRTDLQADYSGPLVRLSLALDNR